ncbi:uncharacterized protein LOC111025110 [Momordica charantia]|uniref:Uncharacterized protein LOC111025110 n=1 Tax=Momordica charantia TaxID=3673 RepID=A0A6J1E1K0_MOMCH|nr:uncharacterized protein LOC111025110 [Momordica charantia]
MDHVETYESLMDFHAYPDAMKCRAFSFAAQQKTQHPAQYLLTIRQEAGESLRNYVRRFLAAQITVSCNKEFASRVHQEQLKWSFVKKPKFTIKASIELARKFMQANNLIQSWENPSRASSTHERRGRDNSRRSPQRQRQYDRNSRPKQKQKYGRPERYDRFTPLNVSVAKIFANIQDSKLNLLTEPNPMSRDPEKHNRLKFCHFHKDHGHDTSDCYDLKRQIEGLIHKGYFKKHKRRAPSR